MNVWQRVFSTMPSVYRRTSIPITQCNTKYSWYWEYILSLLLFPTSVLQRNARTAVSRAERYLLNQYEEEGNFCNYGHALATYALLRRNDNPPRTLTSMLDDLHSRIVTSRSCKCVWCNSWMVHNKLDRSAYNYGSQYMAMGQPRLESSMKLSTKLTRFVSSSRWEAGHARASSWKLFFIFKQTNCEVSHTLGSWCSCNLWQGERQPRISQQSLMYHFVKAVPAML